MTFWTGDFVTAWQAATVADAVLRRQARHAALRFAFESEACRAEFAFNAAPDLPVFTLRAPAEAWAKALLPLPPRHHHSLFAMRMRVPGFRILGAELAFAQHAQLARRVLEIGRWVLAGRNLPVPEIPRPPLAEPEPAEIRGRYLGVPPWRIQVEQAGPEDGLDLLCLHTAGADGRQFHRLMADRRLTRHWRLTAFDLPWHGKSPPPPGEAPGAWFLDTDRYVRIIMGVIAAAGLRRPVVLGASMSGEICLELALRHPDAFRGIVACEASAHIDGRKVAWADHPQVNQAVFVPEWIEGLMAPHSPASCAADVWWHYSQGGHATFARDIDFYSGEWDARDRVHRIDTARCPLWMLTGEYDYSCTAEHSAATAALIPGARFAMMPGIGHFPFAENPPLFAGHLLPILDQLRAA
jgi:pimeloyl-ACP methyl ester carboxylesterase